MKYSFAAYKIKNERNTQKKKFSAMYRIFFSLHLALSLSNKYSFNKWLVRRTAAQMMFSLYVAARFNTYIKHPLPKKMYQRWRFFSVFRVFFSIRRENTHVLEKVRFVLDQAIRKTSGR